MKFIRVGSHRRYWRDMIYVVEDAKRLKQWYQSLVPGLLPPGFWNGVSTVGFRIWGRIRLDWYKKMGEVAKTNFEVGRLPANSRQQIPGDGTIGLPNGFGGEILHWVREEEGRITLFIEYHPGPEDLRFVAACDRDYLNTLLWGPTRRILPNVFPDTTKLRDTEPGVWLLWLRANCPPDIGNWYMVQLELRNIQELVEGADKECQDWSGAQKAQYEHSMREAQAKEVRLTRLRAKLLALIPFVKNVLQSLEAKNQLILLPEELPGLQKLLRKLETLRPQFLGELELTETLKELETWQPYVSSLPAKVALEQETRGRIAELGARLQKLLWGPETSMLPNVFPDTTKLRDAEPGIWLLWVRAHCPPDIGAWYMTQLKLPDIQNIVAAAAQECQDWSGAQKSQYEQPAREAQAKEVRLTALRAKLTTLVPPVMSVLQSFEATRQLTLLPATELLELQKLMSNLTSLQPQVLDEVGLIEAISELEAWQPYISSLPAKITALLAEQETRRRIAELGAQLQALINQAAKVLDPIEARNEIQLLPLDEQQVCQDFISHLRSLKPDALNEVALQSAISFIESNHSYLTILQQKTTELAKQRAAKVAVIEERIRKLLLKIEAAKLASNPEKMLESYVFVRDYYRSIVALGIDCSQQLTELERNIKEAQSKLSSGTLISPQTPVTELSTAPEQLRCRIIPHTELQLDQELGSGAFGTVYRGLWRTEKIAVKRLHSVQLTASSRQAFIAEVEIMTKLDSEHLVRLYGACIAPDPYCIVMEYMPRGSLYSLLHGMEQYSWQVALQVATDIGNGLAFLHREKIIHRDLKSLNVLLDTQYRAKICDFGLSKVRQEVSVTSTRPGTAVGTNAWNAPELFGLHPKYSCASDIYAYGIILWELLTRETPYKDVLDPNQIQIAVKGGEREEIPVTCSATYRATIERCWAQVPEERPQALQVVQALQAELTTISVKSWHIAPELKPNTRNQAGYFFIPAGDYDMRKVVAAYQRSPVPGMEVGRVTIIFNPVLNKSFAEGIELLEGRFGNPAFAAKWDIDGDATIVAWRREIIGRFEAMAHPYQDSASSHVKIMPVWHGTKAAIIESIAKTGYANLATTDPGFFGKGLYGSYEAEYAHRVYGPGQYGVAATLLVNWIACFSAYPVVGYKVPGYTGLVEDPGDMVRLQQKGNFGNYDAHFVPVRPKTSDPNEGSYYPCRPQERATYHEVVVFETARILPRYIVELQPSLLVAPPVAPLLAVTGMFGHKQEPDTVPLLAPAPTP